MAYYVWQPDFTVIDPSAENHAYVWRDAMDWARLEVNTDELKSAFCEWAVTVEFCKSEQLVKIPAWQFQTIGRVALLINRGAIPPADSWEFFNRKLELIKGMLPADEPTEENEDRLLSTKQKRTLEYVDLYSFIDAVRVRFANNTDHIEVLLTERLRAVGPNKQQLKALYGHFKESLNDATGGIDNPLVADTIDALVAVVNVLAGFTGNAKISGMKNKLTVKEQKAADAVAVKTADTETNIQSIKPAMVVGCSMAVVYNTKNRKVMIYTASADTKLGIKGGKLSGFDAAVSFAKTIRKPKMVLPALRDSTTIKRVRVVLDQHVNGKSHVVNGRITKDMIIVKVFK